MRVIYRTSNRCANSSILASICACSERDTADGNEWKLVSQERLRCLAMARLKVLHQMGMVLDKESGIRFPRRVESTMMQLYKGTHKNDDHQQRIYNHMTYPPCSPRISKRCKLLRRILKSHCPIWPSVDLKYTECTLCYPHSIRQSCSMCCIGVPLTWVGSIYHDPHLSFAVYNKQT